MVCVPRSMPIFVGGTGCVDTFFYRKWTILFPTTETPIRMIMVMMVVVVVVVHMLVVIWKRRWHRHHEKMILQRVHVWPPKVLLRRPTRVISINLLIIITPQILRVYQRQHQRHPSTVGARVIIIHHIARRIITIATKTHGQQKDQQHQQQQGQKRRGAEDAFSTPTTAHNTTAVKNVKRPYTWSLFALCPEQYRAVTPRTPHHRNRASSTRHNEGRAMTMLMPWAPTTRKIRRIRTTIHMCIWPLRVGYGWPIPSFIVVSHPSPSSGDTADIAALLRMAREKNASDVSRSPKSWQHKWWCVSIVCRGRLSLGGIASVSVEDWNFFLKRERLVFSLFSYVHPMHTIPQPSSQPSISTWRRETETERKRETETTATTESEMTALNKTIINCQREIVSTWIWNARCCLLCVRRALYNT